MAPNESNNQTKSTHRLRASRALRVTTNLITTLLNTGDGLSMVTMHGYNHGINNINKSKPSKLNTRFKSVMT